MQPESAVLWRTIGLSCLGRILPAFHRTRLSLPPFRREVVRSLHASESSANKRRRVVTAGQVLAAETTFASVRVRDRR